MTGTDPELGQKEGELETMPTSRARRIAWDVWMGVTNSSLGAAGALSQRVAPTAAGMA